MGFRDVGGAINIHAELSHDLSTQFALPLRSVDQHSLLLIAPGMGAESRNAGGSGVFMLTPTVAARGLWGPLTCVPLLRAPAGRGYASAERFSVCVPG